MNWKPLTAEEAKGLKYASRTGKESPYKALLEAVEQGPVRMDVPAASTLQSLKLRVLVPSRSPASTSEAGAHTGVKP
jgi:hypothetical protein